jgi:hypothetical protein
MKTKIYRIITLPVVLHGCETWSLILRKERRLKFFYVGLTVHHELCVDYNQLDALFILSLLN